MSSCKSVLNVAASIPMDPNNTDYQAYLQFLAAGGTPLPSETT